VELGSLCRSCDYLNLCIVMSLFLPVTEPDTFDNTDATFTPSFPVPSRTRISHMFPRTIGVCFSVFPRPFPFHSRCLPPTNQPVRLQVNDSPWPNEVHALLNNKNAGFFFAVPDRLLVAHRCAQRPFALAICRKSPLPVSLILVLSNVVVLC